MTLCSLDVFAGVSAADVSVTGPRSGVNGHLGIEVLAPQIQVEHQNEEIASLRERHGVVIAVESY